MKETYIADAHKRDLRKKPTKETCERDPQKSPTKETYIKDAHNGDQRKRPTKNNHKRDL